jgi:hypothetical protein
MKSLVKMLPICTIFSVALVSCGKFDKSTTIDNSSIDRFSKSSIPTGNATSVSILQGFNKMGFTFTETCIDNNNIFYPKNIEKTVINLSDNMKEADFRNALNIGVSATVPVKGFEISPELKYAREASVTRLSRSTTYFANIRLGDTKIANDRDNKITLKSSAHSYFDSNGKLNDPYNFIKKCGDEAVISQRLSAKILITLKLNFDTQKILDSVEAKLGVAQNILSVAGKIGVNGNVKYLDEETKRGVHLNLYAVQLGGKPAELTKILNLRNSCELNKIEECQSIINILNQYVSDDFNKQLDVNNPESWSIESSRTVPYDELSVSNSSGRLLNFHWVNNYDESVAYSKLKITINQKISRQVDHYLIATSLLDSAHLASDEKNDISDIAYKSEANIEALQNFSKECHKNLSDCLNNSALKLNSLIATYDESFLKPNIGSLVAKIRSSQYPLSGQKYRSSEDFLDFRSIIDSGKYSSLYFKLKTIDNKLIEDNNVRFDIMCNRPWYKGFDQIIFSGLYPGYEILIGTVQKNHDNSCSGTEMGYISSPRNIPTADFSVEVWGRE